MKHPKELEVLLEGVKDPQAQETIKAAYYTFSKADPNSFPVQFAILGAAVSARMDQSVNEFSTVVDKLGKDFVDSKTLGQSVAKEIPQITDLKQLSDQLKRSIVNSKSSQKGGGGVFYLTMFNTILIVLMLLKSFGVL